MIEVKNVVKTFDGFRALDDLTMTVPHGAVYGLVGPNGAGKSTTLNTIAGLLRSKTGSIEFMGQSLAKVPSHKIVAKGLALVPEGRRVFLQMTVQENLEMGAFTQKNAGIAQDLEMVYDLFPRLKERLKQKIGRAHV